jgi:hypothetical protein
MYEAVFTIKDNQYIRLSAGPYTLPKPFSFDAAPMKGYFSQFMPAFYIAGMNCQGNTNVTRIRFFGQAPAFSLRQLPGSPGFQA